MKKWLLIIVFIVFSNSILAQQRVPYYMEILTEVVNAESLDYYKFEIEPVSEKTTWCRDGSHEWEVVTNAATSYVVIEGNNCWTDDYGFDVCSSESGYPDFWITMNKFTIYKDGLGWEEVIYFYIDYRDCRYGIGGGGYDITILIDENTDKAYYAAGLGDSDCDLEEYTEITEDETLNIWEVNDWSGTHDISCFCPTPTLMSVTNQNNHPKVLWSHDDDPNGSYSYEVWQLITQSRLPVGTWYLTYTTTDTSFVDNGINIGDGTYGRVYYKIRAKIDDLKSGYSGYDYISFQSMQKPVVENTNANEITEFKLFTNYPNPFNPSTKITFDIPEKTQVDLAVYDMQGKKVITLVNETLESGNYSVEFNAGKLPSGTYLYKIVSGEFTDSKKMVFVR